MPLDMKWWRHSFFMCCGADGRTQVLLEMIEHLNDQIFELHKQVDKLKQENRRNNEKR